MSENSLAIMYMMMIDMEICLAETLDTIIAINGYNEKTLLDVLYIKTGYRSFDQLEEEF